MVGMSLLRLALFIPEKIAAMLKLGVAQKTIAIYCFCMLAWFLSTIVRESAVRYFRNYQNVQLADA